MTNNTKTKAAALASIDRQIGYSEDLIKTNRDILKSLALLGLSTEAQRQDAEELTRSIVRNEGRLLGLHFAREEIIALE
jgi:hypothetical protein